MELGLILKNSMKIKRLLKVLYKLIENNFQDSQVKEWNISLTLHYLFIEFHHKEQLNKEKQII